MTMVNNRPIYLRIIISCLYIGLALVAYLLDFNLVLMLLGIPWSVPMMMFSGLILHMTVDGKDIISIGSLIGVILNVCIYYFVLRRK